MKKVLSSILGFLALPLVAFAQGASATSVLTQIGGILDILIPIIITLMVVFFLWGLAQYVLAKDDTGKKEGRDRMIQGIIAIFVGLTLFGIINLVQNTFGLNGGGSLDSSDIPSIGA
jgi:hypothetical protein